MSKAAIRARVKVLTAVAALALAVTLVVSVLGAGTAQAHAGGHKGGCAGFGELVSSVLAGPEFGAFLHEFAPSGPGVVAEMVDQQGHTFCD